MSPKNSIALMHRARNVIPGGVNSPVRAFGQVDSQARFMQRGNGAYIYDVDNNQYIDYVCSWGPLILGHSHPAILHAVQQTLSLGTSFGATTAVEIELAELIVDLMPSIEMVRMVSSGTEATMSAIRLARGFTQRNKILKFTGCYHGHNDSLLVQAGSGVMTLSLPDSAGVPADFVKHTLVAPFNDLAASQAIFAKHKHEIAAVIVEPIAANMNLVLPEPGFLAGLRQLCTAANSLLIFDEVITGFRVSLGGAQQLYGITPDLTCLGKIVGGGFPVGAFGGRREIMSALAPLGTVYQAGTLSGNPIAMTAGLATLQQLQNNPNAYAQLNLLATQLAEGLQGLARSHGIPLVTENVTGLFGIKFMADPDHQQFKRFFAEMLAAGIYLAPSPFEAGFVSLAHDEAIIAATLAAADRAFAETVISMRVD